MKELKEINKKTILTLIFIILILSITLILTLTGEIQLQPNQTNSNDKSPNDKEEINNQSTTTTDNEKYSIILDEYKTALNDNNFDQTNEEMYQNINPTVVHNYHNYKKEYNEGTMTLNYVYYDINKDNNNELIVFANDPYKNNNIVEIYTHDGERSKKFINDSCLGERCYVKIYNNGIIFFYGAGGANLHGLEFYKIGNDGYSKENIATFSVKSDENNNITITTNNNKTDYKTDEEVIKSIVKEKEEINISNLEWKTIE